MQETALLIIKITVAIIAGVIAGNGAVWTFNRLPARWLCDYGEEPSEELKNRETQRIKSHPWKNLLSMVFVVAFIYLFSFDIFYGVPVAFAIWILLLIGIADYKYMIIPDQLILLLALCGFGLIPYNSTPKDMFLGALLGGGCMLITSVAGKLIFKKEVMGFGDVKLFAAIGLCCGVLGAAAILVGTSFLSCIAYSVKLLRKKIKKGDEQPLGPYIAVISALWLLLSKSI